MTVTEAIAYIESHYDNKTSLGLHRMQELMAKLGDPQRGLRFIHVAGTNGKGSTCAMLERILREAGFKTGLFTSPHLVRLNERMQIDGQAISDDELCALTEEIRPLAEGVSEPMGTFEVLTAMALTWFARRRCDVVVLEVGLGGEFDATNVIDCPELAVICNIGLDHTELLGNTLTEIAKAKAGIIKPDGNVVIYRGVPAVETVFEERCQAMGAALFKPHFELLSVEDGDVDGLTFSYDWRREMRLGLVGAHQVKNAAVALTAVDVLRRLGWTIPEEAIRRGLAEVVWPARFQVLLREPLFILDGGHNPQCIEALTDNLRELCAGRYIVFLLGVLSGKDAASMGSLLDSLADEFVVTAPDSIRALPAEELAETLRPLGLPVTVCPRSADAVEEAIRRAEAAGGMVCCAGSLYLAGEVLDHFARRKTD